MCLMLQIFQAVPYSMAAEVPVCVSDTLYNDQVDLSVTSNDDQTLQLDTSDESLSPMKYDPTGTELILPLKKRKQIVQNPEKTVTKLWKYDALSRKWSIPLTKLDSRKLYELSQKPPNWSEMDPYSDSDIENISTTPEGNVADSDTNMKKDDENAKHPSRMGNMERSVQSANKYEL